MDLSTLEDELNSRGAAFGALVLMVGNASYWENTSIKDEKTLLSRLNPWVYSHHGRNHIQQHHGVRKRAVQECPNGLPIRPHGVEDIQPSMYYSGRIRNLRAGDFWMGSNTE